MQIRRDNLEDALLLYQFSRDVEDEFQWLIEKEPFATSSDYGNSLNSVQKLQKKHQVLYLTQLFQLWIEHCYLSVGVWLTGPRSRATVTRTRRQCLIQPCPTNDSKRSFCFHPYRIIIRRCFRKIFSNQGLGKHSTPETPRFPGIANGNFGCLVHTSIISCWTFRGRFYNTVFHSFLTRRTKRKFG